MTPKEFTETFIPLGELLYRTAFYMLESRADAEDAVQDLYIRLWDSRERLGELRNPKAYCITLMKNLCIDRIRKNSGKQHSQLEESMPDTEETDSAAIGKDSAKLMAGYIAALPEAQKQVLHLHMAKEMSNDEIASETGMSNLTVRVLLSRARKRLREQLDTTRK